MSSPIFTQADASFFGFLTLDPPLVLAYGLLTGLVFGFLLQKGGVTRYQTILGQFLLKDFTVLKVMLTAIVVGAVGIWGMRSMGLDFPLHIKSAALAGNVVGGLIFGIGMALLGYCPGTGMAALGDGSRHAIPGLLGGIVGASLFAELYPFLQDGFMKWLGVTAMVGGKATDKVTVADVAGVSPWWLILGIAIVAAGVFWVLERRGPRTAQASGGTTLPTPI